MELKQIKELMAAMGRTGTKKLTMKKEGFELSLERDGNDYVRQQENLLDLGDEVGLQNESARRATAALSRARDAAPLSTGTLQPIEKEETTSSIFITSPMVGTFYTSPSPDDPPFIKVGDKIEKNTIVCIIEAMKVMNEVKAGVSGTVVEVLMDSGSPVEFGTKLFRIT